MEGLKAIRERTQKWVLRAKQGLIKSGFLKTKLVSFGENRLGEEGEKREEEEEKKRRRGDQAKIKQREVWKLTLIMVSKRL